MAGETISSVIILILGILRILPSGRTGLSKIVDAIGFSGWMSLAIGCIAAFVYLMSPIYDMFKGSIPDVFSRVSKCIIPVVQVTLTFPALAYFCLKNPGFVYSKVPNPPHIIVFLTSVILNGGFYMQYLLLPTRTSYEKFLQKRSSYAAQFVFVYLALWSISMILSPFVIGTSMRQFANKIKGNGHTIKMIEDISQDMKKLKSGLSPMLFILYSTKCVILIHITVHLAIKGANLHGVSLLVVTLWDLTYVTLVVDETLAIYKDLALKLR